VKNANNQLLDSFSDAVDFECLADDTPGALEFDAVEVWNSDGNALSFRPRGRDERSGELLAYPR
jgi:hypothetical protein